LPLNKNYLRNYLEPKNYLEVPEWQNDSWSGNCWRILHHVVATLTMTKTRIISAKIEDNALLLASSTKTDIENTMMKELNLYH
jgi:hypothetical protein